MSSLDGVDGLNSIPKRSTTTTPTQALNLMNGAWVRQRAAAMAARILDESDGTDRAELVNQAFQLAVGRKPQPDEVPVAVELITHAGQSRQQAAASDLSAALGPQTGPSVKIGEHGFLPPETTAPHPPMVAPFTFVGLVRLDSLYPNATVRTIISQWDDSKTTRGWSIGITSEKSAYKPRNFILQPIGDAGYEVVASDLRPDLDKPYFVAVTVSQSDDGKGQAAFYLQPVNSKYGKLQTATVDFKTARGLKNTLPIVIGGRANSGSHRWDGHIDQVTLFDKALNPDAIEDLFRHHVQQQHAAKYKPVAAWNFNRTKNAGVAAENTKHALQLKKNNVIDPLERAVTELCHVLLNSNEFVYID